MKFILVGATGAISTAAAVVAWACIARVEGAASGSVIETGP